MEELSDFVKNCFKTPDATEYESFVYIDGEFFSSLFSLPAMRNRPATNSIVIHSGEDIGRSSNSTRLENKREINERERFVSRRVRTPERVVPIDVPICHEENVQESAKERK